MWQHIQLSEQIRLQDTLACCYDVKLPTNNNINTRPSETLGMLTFSSPETKRTELWMAWWSTAALQPSKRLLQACVDLCCLLSGVCKDYEPFAHRPPYTSLCPYALLALTSGSVLAKASTVFRRANHAHATFVLFLLFLFCKVLLLLWICCCFSLVCFVLAFCFVFVFVCFCFFCSLSLFCWCVV